MRATGKIQAECIEVRITATLKRLLEDAAQSQHKSVSQYLLDAGVAAASEALPFMLPWSVPYASNSC